MDNPAMGSAFMLCPHDSNAADCDKCQMRPVIGAPAKCPHGNLSMSGCYECHNIGRESLSTVPGFPRSDTNGAGVPRSKLSHKGTGAAMHRERYKINVRRQTAIAQAFKRAGLDWQADLANAIKASNDYTTTASNRKGARERITLWLKLLPYLVTGGRAASAASGGKRKGRASKAALKALEALEGKDRV